jgi:outer membrane receptor for ferrienterochelin and colicin
LELINRVKISDNLAGSLSVYRNIMDNLFKQTSNENGDRWWVNTGEVKTLGFEVEARYQRNDLSAWINYTYTNSKHEDDEIIPEISEHTANAGFHYYINEKVDFGLRSNYVGKRKNNKLIQNTNSEYIDPFFIINASLGFRIIDQIKVHFYINNILNEEYYHTSHRTPDRYRQSQRYFGFEIRYKILSK